MHSPLLDLKQLQTFAMIGYEDYLDLLADITRDVPVHLEAIRAAVHAGNPEEFSSRVHSFRGMICYLGCIVLTRRLTEMEFHQRFAPDQHAAVHSELQDLWDRSLSAIKDWEKSVPDFAPPR